MKKNVLIWTVTVLSFFIFSGCELEKFERPVIDEDSSDADIYEDLLIDMVEVPAGEFLMGC
ncbi:MAG TPA: hypothetical protein PLX56_12705, partial [bacterium]|nr:hypothetical protein [bacterium]